MKDWAIECEGLTCRYGRKEVVRDLDLQVPTGGIYAFLGRNGAGKTTTIKAMAGLLRPSSGSARILAAESESLRPSDWTRIGYVSENQEMYEWLTVEESIRFTSRLYPNWDDSFATELIRQLALRKLQQSPVSELSRGEKVKLALLLSLAYRPELLILDEPFSGLDPLVRDEFLESLLELAAGQEWTVFFSTHQIEEVQKLADHVGIIDEGRLRLSLSMEELESRYRKVTIFGRNESGAEPPPEAVGTRRTGERLAFLHTEWSSEAEESLRRRYAKDDLEIFRPDLREVFVQLARSYREENDHE